MARIWFARQGANSTTGEPRCELSFDKFQQIFGKHPRSYLGTAPPKFLSSNANLDDYRAPQFVVLELEKEDVSRYARKEIGSCPQIQEGFYVVNISTRECDAVLNEYLQ